MVRISLDAMVPDPVVLRYAADAIARGGVVAFPTDTLYGLAVDPRRPEAVDALYRIKGREAGQPLALVAASRTQVEATVGRLPDLGRRLARRFWPGPLTLIIECSQELARALHSASGRVAVRVPAHPIAAALPALVGHALTATSANRSGEAAPATADEVVAALGEVVDVLLDAGPAPGGLPSTLVDVTGDGPLLVRPGAIAWERVLESLTVS